MIVLLILKVVLQLAILKQIYIPFFSGIQSFLQSILLIDVKENQNKVEAIISKECLRIRFLHDSATICRSIFEFEYNKISKISAVENLIFDVSKWQARRDSLVDWIDDNHPDLNGFILILSFVLSD